MKKIYLLILMNLLIYHFGVSQNFSWAKREGLWEYDYGYGLSTDISGNIYVAGKYEQNAIFSGTTIPCAGNHDIYLAKYSSSGSLIWIKTAGGPNGDYAQALASDGKNYVYIAGEIEGGSTINFNGSNTKLHGKGDNDIFVAKYDLDGNLSWAISEGGTGNDKAVGISYDASGNVYVCGQYEGTVSFGGKTTITANGDKDMFVAKYDSKGNFIWVQKAGGPGKDEALSIKSDAEGNTYVCGKYKNGAIFGSNKLICSDLYYSAFIAKYDTDGNLKWVRTGKSDYDDLAWGITMDNSGKIFVAGEFNAYANFGSMGISTTGQNDIFIACYDASGNIQWLKKAGGGAVDRARGIGCDGSNVYITGQFGGTAYFGSTTLKAADESDIFMASLTNEGNFRWALTVGGAADAFEDLGYESGDAIFADPSGVVYATGALLDGGKFGETSLSAYSRTDMFLTKITQEPIANVPSSNFSIPEDSLCVGVEISLDDYSTNSPTSWTWDIAGGTPSSSKEKSPKVNFSKAGIYKITLTAANSKGSGDAITKEIKINDLPNLESSSQSVCMGQKATLNVSGADFYLWSNGDTSSSITVDTNLIAIFSVRGTINGCSKTITDTIYVNPNPEIPVITIFEDSLVSSSKLNNQWYLNDSIISGANLEYLKNGISGIYKVVVKNEFGCTNVSEIVNVILSGISENKTEINIKTYPNPSNGKFMLEISSGKTVYIEVINELGQILQKEFINECSIRNTKPIDLSSHKAGIYFIKVTSGTDTVEKKILIH